MDAYGLFNKMYIYHYLSSSRNNNKECDNQLFENYETLELARDKSLKSPQLRVFLLAHSIIFLTSTK